MTEPLTPPGCDLRDFPKPMIDIPRLFASGFNGTASRNPLAWMIGHKLWYRSWHQVPAGSLPDYDDEQWRKLPSDQRAGLTAALERFRPKISQTCGDRRAPDMARWLRDGKHLDWLATAPADMPEERWAMIVSL